MGTIYVYLKNPVGVSKYLNSPIHLLNVIPMQPPIGHQNIYFYPLLVPGELCFSLPEFLCKLTRKPLVLMKFLGDVDTCTIIYLGFYVAFNTV